MGAYFVMSRPMARGKSPQIRARFEALTCDILPRVAVRRIPGLMGLKLTPAFQLKTFFLWRGEHTHAQATLEEMRQP